MFSELLFDHINNLELVHYHNDEPMSRGSCAPSCSGECITSEVVVPIVIVIVVVACNYKNNNNKNLVSTLYSYPILFVNIFVSCISLAISYTEKNTPTKKKILILITFIFHPPLPPSSLLLVFPSIH